MPAKRSSLVCVCILTLIAVVFLKTASVKSQTGQVSLHGTVSETISLSVAPNFTHGNVDAEVVRSGNSLRLTLTSLNAESPVIRVPLLVRSNSGFRISAVFESKTALLSQLSVIDVHPSGKLVSPQALSALSYMTPFDLRGSDETAPNSPLDISQPAPLL